MSSRSQQKEKQEGTITMNDNCYIQSFHLIEVQKAQYFAKMWFFEEHGILLKIDVTDKYLKRNDNNNFF